MILIDVPDARGTPYANGLFEFDLLLPSEYPHKPPSVTLMTTGKGSVTFNPNLSANGAGTIMLLLHEVTAELCTLSDSRPMSLLGVPSSVCLSLLGTWAGRGWTQDSTLLQVSRSIKALRLASDYYIPNLRSIAVHQMVAQYSCLYPSSPSSWWTSHTTTNIRVIMPAHPDPSRPSRAHTTSEPARRLYGTQLLRW